MALERRSARAVEQSFEEWIDALLREGMTPEEVQALAVNAPQRVRDVLERALVDASDLGVSAAFDTLQGVGLGFDFTLANTAAREWARQYTGQLIARIEETTRGVVREAVARWVDNGEPLEALVDDLRGAGFGARRARLIAATETTRAYQQGTEQAYREAGVIREVEWRTAADERVCPTCGPKHGTRLPLGSYDAPPAHPGCRCWSVPVVGD